VIAACCRPNLSIVAHHEKDGNGGKIAELSLAELVEDEDF